MDLTWESKQGEKKREIQLLTKERKFFPKNLAWKEAWNGWESGFLREGMYEMSQGREKDLRKIYFYIIDVGGDSKKSS